MPKSAVSGHRVYTELRRALVRGELSAGDRLVETDLAASLHVSRTPVREALRRLEGDGFVRRQGNGSVIVAALEDEDIDDIAALRVEVDTLAARLAMQRATPEQWDHLASLASSIGAARPSDAEAHHHAHQQFHRALFAIAFRPRMLQVLENHVLQHLELTELVGPVPANPADSAEKHHELLTALRSGDLARVEEVARAHARLNAPVAREIARQQRSGTKQGTADHPGAGKGAVR